MSPHNGFSTSSATLFSLLLAVMVMSCAPAADDTRASGKTAVSAATGDVAALDDRVPIQVDVATRFAVLQEMRTMLNAVQGIVGGAARGDTAAMRTAATLAGSAAASEAGEAVARQLGTEFVQLGMTTHVSFDSLAADIANGKKRDVVLTRLSTVMGNCVGCHNRFRLVTSQ